MSGKSAHSPILLDEEEEAVKEEAAEVFFTIDKLVEDRRKQKAQEAKAAKELAATRAKRDREFEAEMAQQASILQGLQNTLTMLHAIRDREAAPQPSKRSRHAPPVKK